MTYIAKTISGLESISAGELLGKVILPQTIEFTKKKKDPRTINIIYQLLDKFAFSSLEDITAHVLNNTKKLNQKKVYDIQYARTGTHSFKGMDITYHSGMLLRERGIQIDYKNPEHSIFIDIIDNTCLLGLLISKDICKRHYRIRYNNKSISACIAAALIKITNPKKTDIILDPFCKDAIIPIEAYMLKIKNIHALDPLKNNVRNALLNCKYAKTNIIPQCYEITWLDTLFKKHSINHIITNILISKHDKEPEKLLKEFFHQAEFIVKDTITLITNKPELFKAQATQFQLKKELPVQVGDMKYTVLQWKRN